MLYIEECLGGFKMSLLRFTLLFIILIICQIFPQHNEATKDSIEIILMKKVFIQRYDDMVTGSKLGQPGNYLSTDFKDNSISLSGAMLNDNGTILGINVNGAYKDGLLPIFSNGKLLNKFSIDLRYSILSFNKNGIICDDDSLSEFVQKYLDVDKKFNLKSDIYLKFDSLKSLDKFNKLTFEKDTLDRYLNSYKGRLSQLDSAKFAYHITELKAKIDSINDVVEQDYYSKKNAFYSSRNIEKKKLLNSLNIPVKGISMGWFTTGLNIGRKSFKLFNPNTVLTDQISDLEFINFAFDIQYSYYNWNYSSFGSYYFNIDASFNYDDNFSSLSSITVTDTKNYGINPGDRTTVNKIDAYTGNYLKYQKLLRFKGSLYKFFLNNDQIAIHFSPEIEFLKTSKPVINIEAGLFFQLKSSKDLSSIVNAEIYYQFNDITKIQSETFYLESSNLGIRITFPIQLFQ
jgi:hypothetical protein